MTGRETLGLVSSSFTGHRIPLKSSSLLWGNLGAFFQSELVNSGWVKKMKVD